MRLRHQVALQILPLRYQLMQILAGIGVRIQLFLIYKIISITFLFLAVPGYSLGENPASRGTLGTDVVQISRVTRMNAWLPLANNASRSPRSPPPVLPSLLTSSILASRFKSFHMARLHLAHGFRFLSC